MDSTPSCWGIILAGGDGTRLHGEVIAGRRVDRPKQFLRLGGDTSLLGSCLGRALRLMDRFHVVPVVASTHRSWWADEFVDLPRHNVLVQPSNRGTAPAILVALVHILHQDGDAVVLVLPSDHGIEDEDTLGRALRDVVICAEDNREDVVLLGAHPTHAETEYGWIVPEGTADTAAHRVREFVEKPERERALFLMEQGALWNTFIVAARGTALLRRYLRLAPQLVHGYLSHLARYGWAEEALGDFYRTSGTHDFSREVLGPSPIGLRVIRLPFCGWTDLGTSRRVTAWLRRRGMASSQAAALSTP